MEINRNFNKLGIIENFKSIFISLNSLRNMVLNNTKSITDFFKIKAHAGGWYFFLLPEVKYL